MKKLLTGLALMCFVTMAPVRADAQIIEIVKAVAKKVIKAIDLKIQRLQNNTIWLQEIQKTIENTMSKMKLDEIGDWVKKQKDLYKDYYEELQKVKNIIAYYHKVKDITEKQVRLVAEYKRAWKMFQADKHFTAEELDYIAKVYSGILDQSSKNMDEIIMVINSFKTQMTDAKRLELIDAAADKVNENYYDLTKFNKQGAMLSLQRAKEQDDVDAVRKMYGIK